jgi:hypothetical protein
MTKCDDDIIFALARMIAETARTLATKSTEIIYLKFIATIETILFVKNERFVPEQYVHVK